MPYSKNGYERKTESEILSDLEERFSDLFDTMNNSPSDILWQWMKLTALERQEIELVNEVASEQCSIQTAQGVFLENWGIECGIEKKGDKKAEGYVLVEKDMTDEDIPFSISAGTRFVSAANAYLSDEDDEIPTYIQMTKSKTGESNDYFVSEIEYVGGIDKIIDSSGDEVDTSHYSLNSTYHNYIDWNVSSSSVLIKDEQYTVYVTGVVKKRIEVSSRDEGAETNASINTVTTCTDYPSLVVSNPEKIDGGADEESDQNYRERLLQARRRTFTIENIRDIILGLEGVRSCKVSQDVGTDQSSVDDWDNYSKSGELDITGTEPLYSQEFVPGDQIATLGRITLRGRPVNDPPALVCGIKRDVDSYSSGTYYDWSSLERYEIDQTSTGNRDLEFNVKYNGLDNTKTYRFDVWCENPKNPSFDWSSNLWKIHTTDEGYIRGINDSRGQFFSRVSGSLVYQGSGNDLVFKTHFNGAGFTVTLGVDDGYGFDNVKDSIETYLDYVEEGGYSPVCIQSTVIEASEIEIDVQGAIGITDLADFTNVRREVEEDIENYLESLTIGENVRYARIYQIIMDHDQVNNLKDLEIRREDSSDWGTTDLGLTTEEIADLGTTSFQRI